MQPYCQNPFCENPAYKEVPLSVNYIRDQTKAVCGACEQSYRWGIQHGRMTFRKRKVWVLAITDRGRGPQGQAFGRRQKAEQALIEYLKGHKGYAGGDDTAEARDWLAQHDDDGLRLEIVPTSLEPIRLRRSYW